MQTIAIHSHKGGAGKTTFIINLAIILAKRGMRVCILDYDLAGPNLFTFFDFKPRAYIDNYFRNEANAGDVISNVTDRYDINGELFVILTNPSSENVRYMSNLNEKDAMQMLQSSFTLRKLLESEPYKIDYLLLDTTPGLGYTTMNSFLLTDLIIFMMKLSNADVEGTFSMIAAIMEQIPSKPTLLSNHIPNYIAQDEKFLEQLEFQIKNKMKETADLSDVEILGWIPYDEKLLVYEFQNMLAGLNNESGERIIHAIKYETHPVLTAIEKVVDRIELFEN